ncbi:MAG: carbohydrate transporter rane protein 2, family [Clostridiales bacterium]|nr:carbohydrate transporter rane protein 2, family [Clostridiales bacterium]
MFKSRKSIKLSSFDRFFLFFNDMILLGALLLVLYPVIYIISSSLSSPIAVASGRVVLFPVEFSLRGFKAVFEYRDIVNGFSNTIFYTITGTLINLTMTILAAYPLSRRRMPGKGIIMFLFTFTMIFSGGLIPNYMLNSNLGLLNTRLVMIIPNAISIFNMIIARTFFESNIPEELVEAAQIDGCDHMRFLLKMVLPLSKPIIAVLALYYSVGHWNAYFDAFIYLNNKVLFPLQIILREILVLNSIDSSAIVDPVLATSRQGMADLLKFSLIVVSSLPFMFIYPFVSKHFVKGALTGAIKG